MLYTNKAPADKTTKHIAIIQYNTFLEVRLVFEMFIIFCYSINSTDEIYCSVKARLDRTTNLIIKSDLILKSALLSLVYQLTFLLRFAGT